RAVGPDPDPDRRRTTARSTGPASRPVRHGATQDELPVARLADVEQVLAHRHEAAPGVEALRAGVPGPDAHPERARAVALEPGHCRVHQASAPAIALVRGQDVEALELTVARGHVGMREPAGPRGGMAHRLPAVL